MMVDRRRLLGSLLAGAVLGGCTAPGTGLLSSVPPAAAPVPRLVVLVVIDGLPMRQILAARATLAPDGFARFLDHGRWFANAHYAHGYTVTAAGHAVMMSGAYPQRSGIIGNQWRDPVSGEVVYNTGDLAYQYLGAPTGARAGTSPRKLLVPTLGDVLRERDPQAKVIGVSAKDRGAILPAGHRGTAYIYMSKTGAFSTSTYYLQKLPRWVQEFNAARPAEAYFLSAPGGRCSPGMTARWARPAAPMRARCRTASLGRSTAPTAAACRWSWVVSRIGQGRAISDI